ncbi:MAG TPA: hypothetical protein PLS83_00410 [Methanothrix soehngenii]|nr:hypothetical protein [Methanothrix soehngenii]
MDTRSPSSSELLSIWERGQAETQLRRGLMLLGAFCPKETPDELARLPIGRRDDLLLSLREQIFGPKFSGLATCPRCGQRLEMSFSSEEIRAMPRAEAEPQDLSVSIGEYVVDFRLANSLDLMAISDLKDLDRATQVLIERCLLGANHKGERISVDALPENVIEAALKRMNECDPQADIQLNLSCPECEHKWQAAFDILSFLWREIEAWALHTLQEVHILASAYCWSEAEILSISSLRRRAYLELVSQ